MKISTSLSRCILLSAIFLTSIFSAHSQSLEINEPTSTQQTEVCKLWPLEIELQFGVPIPWYDVKGYEKSTFPNLTLSFRHNYRSLPLATGLSLGYYNTRWFSYEIQDKFGGDGCVASFGSAGLLLGASGEWQFRRGSILSPYASATAGALWTGLETPTFPFIQPSVGVELLHTFRLGFQTTFSSKDLCSYGITIGLVLGGYPYWRNN